MTCLFEKFFGVIVAHCGQTLCTADFWCNSTNRMMMRDCLQFSEVHVLFLRDGLDRWML